MILFDSIIRSTAPATLAQKASHFSDSPSTPSQKKRSASTKHDLRDVGAPFTLTQRTCRSCTLLPRTSPGQRLYPSTYALPFARICPPLGSKCGRPCVLEPMHLSPAHLRITAARSLSSAGLVLPFSASRLHEVSSAASSGDRALFPGTSAMGPLHRGAPSTAPTVKFVRRSSPKAQTAKDLSKQQWNFIGNKRQAPESGVAEALCHLLTT